LIAAISRNVLAVAGAIVTAAGLIAALFSATVKHWMRGHGLLIYYAWLALFLVTLVAINYVNLRKRRLASEHDSAVANSVLGAIPPDSSIVMWLKDNSVANEIPFKYLDAIDTVHAKMEANVIGLDDRVVNKSYRRLAVAMYEFRMLVALNTFPNDDYSIVRLSDQWSWEHRQEASRKIDKAQDALVAAYDHFLVVSHKHGLYSFTVTSSDQLILGINVVVVRAHNRGNLFCNFINRVVSGSQCYLVSERRALTDNFIL
jgi:hypothetical protein